MLLKAAYDDHKHIKIVSAKIHKFMILTMHKNRKYIGSLDFDEASMHLAILNIVTTEHLGWHNFFDQLLDMLS
jgi:aspartate 1-decarboxylase